MTLHLTLDNDATKIRIRPNYGINNVTLNCDIDHEPPETSFSENKLYLNVMQC